MIAPKKKISLLFSAAVLLVSLMSTARPALAWSCDALTGHSWLCVENNVAYFVDYHDGSYTYIRL